MTTLENLKNNLIDNIIASKNEEVLNVIASIFKVMKSEEKISFSSEQLEMLAMSERDIEYGNLISQEELDKIDSEWMD